MKKIEINTDILNTNVNEILSDVEDILSTIDKTYNGILILNGMWEGFANDEFNRQFVSDYERLKEICFELNTFALKLAEAKNKYEECEERVGSVIAAIRF